MVSSHRFADHVGDVSVEIEASSLPELFIEAARLARLVGRHSTTMNCTRRFLARAASLVPSSRGLSGP